MLHLRSIVRVLTLVAALAGGGILGAPAAGAEYQPLVTSGSTATPVGAYEFCKSLPLECRPSSKLPTLIVLTEALWAELLEVNARFNAEISPVSDQMLYNVAERWSYPAKYGDCEDFALAKRRALIERGWPTSTLLMAVVRKSDGEGHAVLMVPTDRGDLVLDNLEGLILPWSDTSYGYVKRQSQTDPRSWVGITQEPVGLFASLTSSPASGD